MKYFKSIDGLSAVWAQSEECAWTVFYYPAMHLSKISCESGPDAVKWAMQVMTNAEPCTEQEFNDIYDRVIDHQRNYRKEETI